MVGLLVFIIVVLIVLALLCYAVELVPIPGTQSGLFKRLIQVMLVIIAAVIIINRAGLLNG